jgi:alkanesulfonate monooxygenase SsuD/methylene tetrahydromethanopterin reductase-like flavin-dependent oxidoreductase (luciferase family)
MIDIVSGGRLEFTLGAAWAEREFKAFGLPFPAIGERMRRLAEALDIVKALWTQDRTNYEGTYYAINHAPCEPKPVQKPYPPITVGGDGPRTLRLAAIHANGWNGQGSPARIAERIAILRAECEAVERDPAEIELSVHPQLAIARTHAQAESRARSVCASLDQDLDERREYWLLGTPDEVKEQVKAHLNVGVTHWIMGVAPPYDQEMLALFANEVIPEFR